LKIALICTEKLPVPPVAGGAVQMYIHGILPYLSKHHDITVYGVQHPELPNEEESGNVRFIRVPGKTSSEYVNNVKNALDGSFDLVHVFNRPKFLLAFSEKMPGSRFSLSVHNEMFHTEKISDDEGKKCIEKAEFINTISGFIANTILSRFPEAKEKIRVVYSGVDLKCFNPGWTKEGVQRKKELKEKFGLTDKKVVLYVSRLSVKKGAHIVIKAMEQVMATHKDAALVIVGSKWYGKDDVDEYVKYLRELSRKLSGTVLFTGFVPPSGVADYFNMADIFVCASQWNEPLARVHYEAMAAGLPIITTNRGGNPEVVKGFGNGIVIDEFNNPDVFAKCIKELLDNPEKALEMGKKGRELALEKFSWERVANEVIKPFARGQEVYQ